MENSQKLVVLGRKLADLWLACYTQQEIAEAMGVSQQAVSDFVTFSINGKDSVSNKSPETDEEGGTLLNLR